MTVQARTVAVLFSESQLAAGLARRLAQDGVTAVPIANSDELYGFFRQACVDAVVVDTRQRGFFTGLEIVERLAADLVRPVTVLAGALTADEQRRATQPGVDKLVASRSDFDAIAEALKASMLVASQTGVLVPAEARALVQCNASIAPLPQLLVKLAGHLDNPSASVSDVARDIGTDARITAELLRLVNSAAFGLRGRVSRVLDAVSLLGIRQTVALVLSATVQRVQREYLRRLPDELQATVRVRSVLTAGTASAFARRLKNASPESAQVLGLLQDLGIVVLLHAHGERYQQLLRRVRSVAALRLEHSEQQEYGFTHADASAALLQKWELPASIVSLVLDHHRETERCGRPSTEQQLLRLMQIGEAAADLRESHSPQRYHVLSRLVEPFGGADSDLCRTALAEAVAWTRESCRLFGVPAPDDAELSEAIERSVHSALTADSEVAHGDDAEPIGPPDPADFSTTRAVLVVEDDPTSVDILGVILKSMGLDLRHCTTAAEARKLVRGAAAVLCDVHLGRENGIDIVRMLRRDGHRLPIIGISGDRTRQTVTGLVDAGINDYIVKPFDSTVVVEKLRQHLRLEADVSALRRKPRGDAGSTVGHHEARGELALQGR